MKIWYLSHLEITHAGEISSFKENVLMFFKIAIKMLRFNATL